jgi:hypothetical protein
VPALPLVPANAEEEEKWRAAVGPRADHYLARWRAMAAKNAISWNWPACLASLFWFGYRKMWLPMIGVLVSLGAAERDRRRQSAGGAGDAAGQHRHHLRHRQLRQSSLPPADRAAGGAGPGPDRQAVLAGLKARGGVSMPALVVSLAILGLFVLVVLIAGIQAAQEEQNRMDAQNLLNLQQQQQDPYSTG